MNNELLCLFMPYLAESVSSTKRTIHCWILLLIKTSKSSQTKNHFQPSMNCFFNEHFLSWMWCILSTFALCNNSAYENLRNRSSQNDSCICVFSTSAFIKSMNCMVYCRTFGRTHKIHNNMRYVYLWKIIIFLPLQMII